MKSKVFKDITKICGISRSHVENILSESVCLLEVYENYDEACGCNSLTFCLTSLVEFGHFRDNSLTYFVEINSQTTTSLFLVIVGPSRKERQLNRAKPSIIHLYIIRGIMGNRIQAFSSDASKYIGPYLSALNSNEPYISIKCRATTSYEKVVATSIVKIIFGPSKNLSNDLMTVTNNLKMMMTKEICRETVHLSIGMLMPQHFILMNYRVNDNNNETPTELKHQTEILKLPYHFLFVIKLRYLAIEVS
ncbi:unnamed protein product [Rotaria sp. Silwood1]|nr:unnamed protein product [Rotaria sp. Silwood1]